MSGCGHQSRQPRGRHYLGIVMYSQNPQHHQPHGGYSKQAAPSGGMGVGWDQRSGGTGQVPPQGGSYHYSVSYHKYSSRCPGGVQAPMNPQAPGGYGPPSSYPQSALGQQSYWQGYSGQRYDNHIQGQQYYGQQSMTSQPGYQSYHPQQDAYTNSAYGGAQQGYGIPMPTQLGAPTYQGPTPTQQSSSTLPPQPGPDYGHAYGTIIGGTDGYLQSSGGYQQPVSHVASANPQQGMQSGVYGQYPSTQSGYTDQAVSNNANYGYYGGLNRCYCVWQ